MITTAATLFYGRRSRNHRITFDDHDLGFPSNSDSKNHRPNSRRRHRHNSDRGDATRSRRHLSASNRLSVAVTEPQEGCHENSPSPNVVDREVVQDGTISGRHGVNRRLPISVVLARERLLHRLRGDSASGISRDCEEPLASVHRNNFRPADDGGIIVQGEFPTTRDAISNENHTDLGIQHQQSAQVGVLGPNRKPQGLTLETISQLQHEVFHKVSDSCTLSKTAKDCSICLESFVEGNELLYLRCGHNFHSKCLYPWLQSCGECPNCRSCIASTS